MRALHIIATVTVLAAEAAVLARAILRPHREPASRMAWVMIILVAPIVGMIAYLLVGETRVALVRRSAAKGAEPPAPAGDEAVALALADGAYAAPFALARTVNGLGPTSGNRARLAADSNAAIDEMVADIDAARHSVHLSAYIWLADNNGLKMKDALVRAAKRGVDVCALVDALGSRPFIRSSHWRDLTGSGAQMLVALRFGNPLRLVFRGRIDLRNHRKSLVIDDAIAWCGSQNVADPEFRIKPRFAPWVDIMTRWEGPAVAHCQHLFLSDWIGEGGSQAGPSQFDGPVPPVEQGRIAAQVIGTGPTARFDAMPACFAELIHAARRELVITTPYFVPDEQLLFALTSAARRGVRVHLILPKCNDSWIVGATSRSYYSDLLDAGVELFEFRPGLLHAKTMIVDQSVGLIGSANLDRRSFELNFENNILFLDQAFARRIAARQVDYIKQSDRVTRERVDNWGIATRLWQNGLAMLSPVL
jgi:cardiolipin synthase